MIILRDKNFSNPYSQKLLVGLETTGGPISTNPTLIELAKIINNQELVNLYNKIPPDAFETDPIYTLKDSCSYDVRVNTGELIIFDLEDMDDDTDNLIVWVEKDEKPMMLADKNLQEITKENLIRFYENNYVKFRLDADGEQEYYRPKKKRSSSVPRDKAVIDYTDQLISAIKKSKLE
jgi:hypothetical protein